MPNRYVCDVLEEIRKCYETRNFSGLLGLIEEVQTLVNRMEAGLRDYSDAGYNEDRIADIKKELKELKKEKRKLQNESQD
jgi:hypothetical protein